EAGVEILFHAWLLDARVSDGRIHEVRVQTKGGIETVRATHFVDATGDADLAAASGVAFDVGRPEDGLCQPCTLMFRMAGVETESLLKGGLGEARRRVSERFDAARQAGSLEYPYKTWVQFYEYPRANTLHFNMTRVWQKSGIEARAFSDAEREGRRQARIFTDWIARETPWFRHGYLETLGAQIGVRETRRIRGRYRMTADDIRAGARFEDGIARSGYFIDIHDPKGASDPHAVAGGRGAVKAEFKPKRYYEVPFRCLQPEGMENLLVACRAISTTFEAHAAVRVMATMHAVGEAAGRAAALARRTNTEVSKVNGAELRAEIGYLEDRPVARAPEDAGVT
ncbi:MAG: FAD-dependent oxidoreductase, partial [Planctomycetota bacterium]|nr:FAD-dependent oxidoreductase [Planctomycetota bacterium]